MCGAINNVQIRAASEVVWFTNQENLKNSPQKTVSWLGQDTGSRSVKRITT